MTKSSMGINGEVTLQCFGSDGSLKWEEVQHNKITTVGDQYYAKMGCAGVGGNSAPSNLANGMKLGTASTAADKSTLGAASISTGSYISGSNNTFDTVVAAVVSGDTGWKITYVATWGAGDATATIQEIAICTDQATDNTSTNGLSACISRSVISPSRVKAAGDTLVATYVHTFLGA